MNYIHLSVPLLILFLLKSLSSVLYYGVFIGVLLTILIQLYLFVCFLRAKNKDNPITVNLSTLPHTI